MRPAWKHAALGAAAFLLAFLSWTGTTGGVQQIPVSKTTGQLVQSWTQLAYGLLSAAVVVTAFWFRSVRRSVQLTWLGVITVSGGLAPVVWGESNLVVGLIAAASTVLVGWGILKLLEIGTRRPAT